MSRPSVQRVAVRDVVAVVLSRLISAVVIPLGVLLTRGSRRRLAGHPEQAVRDACDIVESLDRARRARAE